MSPGMKLWMTSILPFSSPCNTFADVRGTLLWFQILALSLLSKHKHNFRWREWDDLAVKAPALAVRVNPALVPIPCGLSRKLFQASGPRELSVQSLGWPQGTSGLGPMTWLVSQLSWEGGLSVCFPLVSGPSTLAQPHLLPGVPKAPSLPP